MNYYQRQQVRTSYIVGKKLLITFLAMLLLAALFSLAHDEELQDLAQLTPQQRAEIMGRWK